MKKNKFVESIKNILIVVLIVYAIYQFFDMYTNVSLSDIFTSWVTKDEESNDFYFMPQETMISFGDKEFVKINEGTLQEELVNDYIKEIYDLIFKTKHSFDEVEANIVSIMNERSIILCYDDYDYEMTEELFGISNDRILRSINKIEKIVIRPTASEGEKGICFVYGNDKAIMFELNIDTTELYGLIDEINLFETMNIYLLSENYDYRNHFKKEIFIPAAIIDNDMFNRNENITMDMPFDNDEEALDNYINTFFINPNAKWKMEKEQDVLLYGDGERTLTVYKEGFFNYTYTNVSNESITLNDAIKIANEKISKDLYLSDRIKLSNVRKVNDNTYELSYDYYINNSKITIANAIKNKYKIKYPITFVISGGDIINIKALIININEEILDEEEIVNNKTYNIISYDNILNKMITDFPDSLFTSLKIGYFKSSMNQNPTLKWIMETDKEIYTFDIQ